MIYFTSDLHLNHDRGFIFKPRGFESIEEMNNAVVENWNKTVKDDDTVYVLGDLMLGGTDNTKSIEILKTLKGKIKIIAGNHDTEKRICSYLELPNVQSVSYAEVLKYNGYHFFLCHYPTMTGNLEKETLKQVTICLCGHTHSKEKFYNDIPYIYNVSCDAHNCTPVSVDEIISDCEQKVLECKELL